MSIFTAYSKRGQELFIYYIQFVCSIFTVNRKWVSNFYINEFIKSRKSPLIEHSLFLLRVSEANEVPIISHVWVASSTIRQLKPLKKIGKN